MSTKVGIVFISYDIDSKHVEVKNAMKNLSYHESWKNQNDPKSYVLPNTTLWHQSKSTDSAIADIKSICNRLSVKLEKTIAVIASDFAGI